MSLKAKIWIALAINCVVWGSTWSVIKIGLEGIPPYLSAGLRFGVAAIILRAVVWRMKLTFPKGKEFTSLVLELGFTSFAIPFALVYYAGQYIPSALSSILFAVYPFCVAILSAFRLKNEPLNGFQWTGTALGFLGIYWIFKDQLTDEMTASVMGMIAMVLSALLQANSIISLRKRGHQFDTVVTTFTSITIASVALLAFSFIVEYDQPVVWNATTILSTLYLGIFATVITFISYFWLVRHVAPVLLALTAFVTPIFALLIGWFIMNESLGPEVLTGALFVLAGIVTAKGQDLYTAFRSRKRLIT